MSDFSFLPGLFEILLVLAATVALLPRIFLISCANRWIPVLFVVVLGLCLASVLLGGGAVAAMTVKVLSFSIITFFALRKPKAACSWLLCSVLIELVAQAAAGNVMNKYSPIPYVLLASLWAASNARVGTREFIVIFLALVAECVQALVLESRGLLLLSVIAFGMLFGPLRRLRLAVVASAVLLPVVYPLTLSLVFAAFLSGSSLLEGTASNFERSAMSAWCINNLSSYFFVGPGGSLFADEINTLKDVVGQVNFDAYDPHQFLLSAWLWLGSFMLAALYTGWCTIWLPKGRQWYGFADGRIRYYSILATIAILTFVLSPPDSSRRVQVGLLTGIAIVGLRAPSILVRKKRMNVAQTKLTRSHSNRIDQSV